MQDMHVSSPEQMLKESQQLALMHSSDVASPVVRAESQMPVLVLCRQGVTQAPRSASKALVPQLGSGGAPWKHAKQATSL